MRHAVPYFVYIFIIWWIFRLFQVFETFSLFDSNTDINNLYARFFVFSFLLGIYQVVELLLFNNSIFNLLSLTNFLKWNTYQFMFSVTMYCSFPEYLLTLPGSFLFSLSSPPLPFFPSSPLPSFLPYWVLSSRLLT